MVSDIPAEDGKLVNLFYGVYCTCTWSVRLLFPGPLSPERSTRLALASTQYNFVTCIYGLYKNKYIFVYRHRLRIKACLILCLLLRRLSSFRAFSYSHQFHYTPSPMTLSFIKCLLLPRLSSFRAFSYGA